jgi:hypothetical protein
MHFWTLLMPNENYDCQRAQPTLRLYSSRFVVESCDVFVGNRTLFEQFGNISTVWGPNESFWSSGDLFGISSRLESSLQFRQKPGKPFHPSFDVLGMTMHLSGLQESQTKEGRIEKKSSKVRKVQEAVQMALSDAQRFTVCWISPQDTLPDVHLDMFF